MSRSSLDSDISFIALERYPASMHFFFAGVWAEEGVR